MRVPAVVGRDDLHAVLARARWSARRCCACRRRRSAPSCRRARASTRGDARTSMRAAPRAGWPPIAVQEQRRLVEQPLRRAAMLQDHGLREPLPADRAPPSQLTSLRVDDDRQMLAALRLADDPFDQLEAAHVRQIEIEHHAVEAPLAAALRSASLAVLATAAIARPRRPSSSHDRFALRRVVARRPAARCFGAVDEVAEACRTPRRPARRVWIGLVTKRRRPCSRRARAARRSR